MACHCGATPEGHCPYCRRPYKPARLNYGPVEFDDNAVIVLVGPPGSGKTTLACAMLQQFGGSILGNEMSSYDPWGLRVIKRLPSYGNVGIDSLETVKIPGLLARRAGLTIGIARLNARGGLYGGLADLYDCDVMLVLDPLTDTIELHKTRYQADKGGKIRYRVEYPRFVMDNDFVRDEEDEEEGTNG